VNKTTGEIIPTLSIVTCKANGIMSKIHNNPKLPEARMPVILPKDKQNEWLGPYDDNLSEKNLLNLCVPYPDELLKYHTVGPLRGKNYAGDTPQSEAPVHYEELASEFPS